MDTGCVRLIQAVDDMIRQLPALAQSFDELPIAGIAARVELPSRFILRASDVTTRGTCPHYAAARMDSQLL